MVGQFKEECLQIHTEQARNGAVSRDQPLRPGVVRKGALFRADRAMGIAAMAGQGRQIQGEPEGKDSLAEAAEKQLSLLNA